MLLVGIYLFGFGFTMHCLMNGKSRLPPDQAPSPESMFLASVLWPFVWTSLAFDQWGRGK